LGRASEIVNFNIYRLFPGFFNVGKTALVSLDDIPL